MQLAPGSALGHSVSAGKELGTENPKGDNSTELFLTGQGRFPYIYLNKLLQRQNSKYDSADLNMFTPIF